MEDESPQTVVSLPGGGLTPQLSQSFMDHVKSSCLRPFPPLYFMVGLVEEVAELCEELEKQQQQQDEQVIAEMGDVLWYVFALCNTLQDVHPVTKKEADFLVNNNPSCSSPCSILLSTVGSLCGSLKKWSRGDKTWEEFQPRIQNQVSSLMSVLSSLCSLKAAMESNIAKIQGRRDRGTLRGDGSNR